VNDKAIKAWAAPAAAMLGELDRAAKRGSHAAFIEALSAAVLNMGFPDWMALADDLAYEMALGAALTVAEREELAGLREAALAAGDFDPIAGAIEYIGRKTPIASKLRTAEWERVPVELVERAQFSAGVESMRVLGGIQEKMMARIAHAQEALANGKSAFVDRSSFIGDLRKIAQEEGLDPERLSRTFTTELQEVAGMGVHAVELTPATLARVCVLPEGRRGRGGRGGR
jgi:hypothetical protein